MWQVVEILFSGVILLELTLRKIWSEDLHLKLTDICTPHYIEYSSKFEIRKKCGHVVTVRSWPNNARFCPEENVLIVFIADPTDTTSVSGTADTHISLLRTHPANGPPIPTVSTVDCCGTDPAAHSATSTGTRWNAAPTLPPVGNFSSWSVLTSDFVSLLCYTRNVRFFFLRASTRTDMRGEALRFSACGTGLMVNAYSQCEISYWVGLPSAGRCREIDSSNLACQVECEQFKRQQLRQDQISMRQVHGAWVSSHTNVRSWGKRTLCFWAMFTIFSQCWREDTWCSMRLASLSSIVNHTGVKERWRPSSQISRV